MGLVHELQLEPPLLVDSTLCIIAISLNLVHTYTLVTTHSWESSLWCWYTREQTWAASLKLSTFYSAGGHLIKTQPKYTHLMKACNTFSSLSLPLPLRRVLKENRSAVDSYTLGTFLTNEHIVHRTVLAIVPLPSILYQASMLCQAGTRSCPWQQQFCGEACWKVGRLQKSPQLQQMY